MQPHDRFYKIDEDFRNPYARDRDRIIHSGSFRNVSSLEKRYNGFNGLNLTFATLEGILKHSYPYKKSFLPSIIDEQFNLETHPSIEAMVVDRADEIAYITHNIDDEVNSSL